MRVGATLLLALVLAGPSANAAAKSKRPLSNRAACARLMSVTGLDHIHPQETVPGAKPWCDFASIAEYKFAIIGLHSARVCQDGCSSLVGWYAVERKTGAIYEWDVNESVVGARVDVYRY